MFREVRNLIQNLDQTDIACTQVQQLSTVGEEQQMMAKTGTLSLVMCL